MSSAKNFCSVSTSDSNMDLTGENAIVNTGNGILDIDSKTAEVEWTRPFDVTSSTIMTMY